MGREGDVKRVEGEYERDSLKIKNPHPTLRVEWGTRGARLDDSKEVIGDF